MVIEAVLGAKNNLLKDLLLYTSRAKTIIYFEDSGKFWLFEKTCKKISKLIQDILEVNNTELNALMDSLDTS